MVYTIGNTQNYRKELTEKGDLFRKVGRGIINEDEYYQGGSVWRTAEEAQDYLDNNSPRLDMYSVWEIKADFDTQTVKPDRSDNVSWNDLLIDSQIIREVLHE